MSWMEGRRIRRVRKPTPWQRWVARWHDWLEDTLEKAVCCGVDPVTLQDIEATRSSLGGKQASSVFSIRSMSAYRDDSEFGDYDDQGDALSDTESESSEDQLSASQRSTSIDMDRRCSVEEWEEGERRASVSSDYIPFEDDEVSIRSALNYTASCSQDQDLPFELELVIGRRAGIVHSANLDVILLKQALHHRSIFNCVLAELLMTSHPVVLWL